VRGDTYRVNAGTPSASEASRTAAAREHLVVGLDAEGVEGIPHDHVDQLELVEPRDEHVVVTRAARRLRDVRHAGGELDPPARRLDDHGPSLTPSCCARVVLISTYAAGTASSDCCMPLKS
jgi:hypothetical protein